MQRKAALLFIGLVMSITLQVMVLHPIYHLGTDDIQPQHVVIHKADLPDDEKHWLPIIAQTAVLTFLPILLATSMIQARMLQTKQAVRHFLLAVFYQSSYR
ncbi:hypothetical protein SAMN05421663_10697 [Terribacillus halophilus]|uniref:Uncharacterized protein n=1 Tax=Terribacillus halophilus TaxID=361279 RepID=A0A1G6RKN0_9BACI|nr:hypothetical protein [Terribacillus halophilus]SDD04981.1 hypothetical protein SAMN05421663_10697 [Terribacillus halophilus]